MVAGQDMSMIRSKLDDHEGPELQMRRRVREQALEAFRGCVFCQILVDNNPVSCILHPAGSARP